MVPAILAQLPGFKLTSKLAFVPALNVVLWMKEVLVDGWVLSHFFLVIISSLAYALMALVLASKIFAQERVILGERGAFRLLPTTRRMRPDPGEGLTVFGMGLVLLFYVGATWQAHSLWWGLFGTLWLGVFGFSLGMARLLRVDIRETFQLYRPPVMGVVAAALLGVSAWVVVIVLNEWLQRWILPTPPPEFAQAMASLSMEPETFWGWVRLIFLIAISPGFCEEFFFRGFVLSSFRDRMKPWLAIGLTGLLFGVFHLSIYRLFGATMFGLIAGVLVFRSRSLWLGCIFHALNNATVVVLSIVAPQHLVEGGLPAWLIAVGVALTVVGGVLLWRMPAVPQPR